MVTPCRLVGVARVGACASLNFPIGRQWQRPLDAYMDNRRAFSARSFLRVDRRAGAVRAADEPVGPRSATRRWHPAPSAIARDSVRPWPGRPWSTAFPVFAAMRGYAPPPRRATELR